MTINKNINGFGVIRDIVKDQLVTRSFMGGSKKQSIAMFKKWVKTL